VNDGSSPTVLLRVEVTQIASKVEDPGWPAYGGSKLVVTDRVDVKLITGFEV
jgi:hypothetical protein